MNQTLSTQIGYTPSGSALGSTVVIGRDITSAWEAIGFGSQGRPDVLEKLNINLTSLSGTITRKGVVSIDVASLVAVINANPNAPATGFQFGFREVAVCELDANGDSVEKLMMVISSQTYASGQR